MIKYIGIRFIGNFCYFQKIESASRTEKNYSRTGSGFGRYINLKAAIHKEYNNKPNLITTVNYPPNFENKDKGKNR
jgi:hypothetical protein